jgi:hypothetical protein
VFWSLALPLLFYVYYARVLLEAESLWVFFHLLMPGVLGIATQSFGLCQKWLILYFLVVANVHYEILAVPLQRDTVRRARAERSGRPAIKSAAVPQTRASWALRIASAPAEAARVRSPSRSILARGRWSTSSASRSFQPPKGKCG